MKNTLIFMTIHMEYQQNQQQHSIIKKLISFIFMMIRSIETTGGLLYVSR